MRTVGHGTSRVMITPMRIPRKNESGVGIRVSCLVVIVQNHATATVTQRIRSYSTSAPELSLIVLLKHRQASTLEQEIPWCHQPHMVHRRPLPLPNHTYPPHPP